MRRALKPLNHTMMSAIGAPIQLRMALNTGVALAGDIGSQMRRDYTVLGDVVNTASRMESAVAAPGQIVITRATFDQLGGRVDARSLGKISLRGRREPIEMFEIVPDPEPLD
jgi:adenylate cyclase